MKGASPEAWERATKAEDILVIVKNSFWILEFWGFWILEFGVWSFGFLDFGTFGDFDNFGLL